MSKSCRETSPLSPKSPDFGAEKVHDSLLQLQWDDFQGGEKEEALLKLMDLLSTQRALVKTVRCEGWNELFDKLTGPRTRTPTTLMPAHGRGMRLFMDPWRAPCALVWSLEELDISDAYMWPSGYFAKTEFNMNADGTLLEGRDSALVTLEQLRLANDSGDYTDFITNRVVHGQVMPYNEVLVGVEGQKGLVGVLVRTTQARQLLTAMGVRDKLTHLFPGLGALPIVIHDPDKGIRPFSLGAQSRLVHKCLELESPLHLHFPLDLRFMASSPDATELKPFELLSFHGKFGVTEETLARCVDAVRRETRGNDSMFTSSECEFAELAAFTLIALDTAVHADNAESVLTIVRVLAPIMFGTNATMAPSVGSPLAVHDPSVTLSTILLIAHSTGVRVAVGALLSLESFANGRSREKVSNARALLEEWLLRASSVFFRLESLVDEKRSRCHRLPSPKELEITVTDRIISNRTLFLKVLQEVEQSASRLEFFTHLKDLALKLLNPCLRLQVLQGILGLDESYNRDTVVGVLKLTVELVESIDGPTEELPKGSKNM